ncbi:MAG: class I SAM-dependent RNA methyltransferase [Porticoccaceae bacterium]
MPAVNDIFTASVRDLSSDGNGVVEHRSGQIFFVPGVWPGEEGEFRVTGFRKSFGFARLVKLLRPAPERVTPQCVHQGFGRDDCGGCPWQFVTYEAQLAAKEMRVRRALSRLGLDERIRPIWGSPQQFGYRNRAQLKSDGRAIGYVAQGSNRLVAIDDCPILSDHNRQTLKDFLATLPNPALRPSRKAQWSTLDIDEALTAETVSINRRRPFQQANSAQNLRMRDWLARSLANADKALPVVELFAGSGNFTEVLHNAGFERILAVEGVAEAVDALDTQGWRGVEGLVCDLFSEAGARTAAQAASGSGVLVLDPPRDGFRHIGTLTTALSKLRHIAYISCDLATFVRDMQTLLQQGFVVDHIQPLDLFPHTPHVELLAALRKP